MLGRKLCELAQLAGLTQSDMAKHLGVTRVQVHHWAHGVRPLPEHCRTKLTAFVMEAVRRRVEELKPPALAALAGPRRSLTPREKLKNQLLLLAGECLIADMEAVGEGPTATVPDVLNALDHFKTLNPEELRQPANAEKLSQLATSLAEHADLIRRIGPLFDVLHKEERHALDCGQFRPCGADGAAGASHK